MSRKKIEDMTSVFSICSYSPGGSNQLAPGILQRNPPELSSSLTDLLVGLIREIKEDVGGRNRPLRRDVVSVCEIMMTKSRCSNKQQTQ